MSSRVQEKRREDRREATGVVRVRFSDPRTIEIEGQLMDVSSNGFRMSHGCAMLEAGQLVEFSHIEATGRARVMWNRILAERVESGFLVLAAQE
jgi:hypothetical protein